ncbi:MAG: hypothetical protein KKB34_15180 [Bacteroidetes bacterium]|nr:hypothetical protein [Bacteroidota bacterium]
MKKIFLISFIFSSIICAQSTASEEYILADKMPNSIFGPRGKMIEIIKEDTEGNEVLDTLYVKYSINRNYSVSDSGKGDVKTRIKNFIEPNFTHIRKTLDSLFVNVVISSIYIDEIAYKIISVIESAQELKTEKLVEQKIKIAEKLDIGSVSFRNKDNKIPIYNVSQKDSGKQIDGDWFINKGKTGTVSDFQITFEDGFIKSAVAQINTDSEVIFFYNRYPISVKKNNDISKLNSPGQYALTSNLFDLENSYTVDLYDLIIYKQRLVSGSGNYFPSNNQVVRLNIDSVSIDLKKSSFINDFSIAIYTDVTGLKRDNPNGLIQIEGEYEYLGWTERQFIALGGYGYYFHRLIPYLSFTKLEDKLNVLALDYYEDKQYTSIFNLLKYSNLNFGLKLNLISLIGQSWLFNLDVKGGLLRTAVADSIVKEAEKLSDTDENPKWVNYGERNLNSVYIAPSIQYSVIPNPHVNINLSYGVIFSELLSNEITVVKKSVRADKVSQNKYSNFLDPANIIQVFQADLKVIIDPINKKENLFFRSAFYWRKPSSNYTLQLGYAFPVTKLFTLVSNSD